MFRCSEHHEGRATPDSVLSGHGCPTCACGGFRPEFEALFYTLRIARGCEEYVGFGISGDIRRRLREHKKNLRNAGFDSQVLSMQHFKRGADALALENLIKESIPCVNLQVDGFRTEAVGIRSHQALQSIIGGVS